MTVTPTDTARPGWDDWADTALAVANSHTPRAAQTTNTAREVPPMFEPEPADNTTPEAEVIALPIPGQRRPADDQAETTDQAGMPDAEWIADYDRRHGIAPELVAAADAELAEDRADEDADDDQDEDDAAPLSGTVTLGRELAGEAGPATADTGWSKARLSVSAVWDHRVTAVVRRGLRFTVRHLLLLVAGVPVTLRRIWHARTPATHTAMMRQASEHGDHASALEWEKRAAEFRMQRHTRRTEALRWPVHAATGLAHGVIAVTILLLLSGIALSATHAGGVLEPFTTFFDTVVTIWHVIGLIWRPALLAGLVASVVGLHRAGRAGFDLPRWLTPAAPEQAGPEAPGVLITADAIVTALANMNISALNQKLKAGWRPRFITGPIRDGQGYKVVFDLPQGVDPEDVIQKKRALLAHNLSRDVSEVWPAPAGLPGVSAVELWAADPGELNKPAPPFPFMDEGSCDVFTAIPIGTMPRGNALTVRLVGNNMVAGGMMGQGKSNLMRLVMLGAALDPLAVLAVFVFAGNGDFDAYAPRLAQYHRSAEVKPVISAAMDYLHWLYGEVGRREDKLARLGAKKLTRKIASQHKDMRPITVLFSECHELFGDKQHGEMAEELCRSVIRRARKTGITLLFDTQQARRGAIPPSIVSLVSLNACFAVKAWRDNDGFLGDGSYEAGIRATELRPSIDVGKCLMTGVSANKFEIVKNHYIAQDDDAGTDSATAVIERAMGMLKPGTRVAADNDDDQEPAEAAPDLLADVAAILDGAPRMLVQEVMQRLAETGEHYRTMTNAEFKAAMKAAGAPTYVSDGRMTVHGGKVRDALAARPAAESDTGAELDSQ